jgi:glutaredoxin
MDKRILFVSFLFLLATALGVLAFSDNNESLEGKPTEVVKVEDGGSEPDVSADGVNKEEGSKSYSADTRESKPVETQVPEDSGGVVRADSGDRILFYSSTCSHCAVVEKYIIDNQVLSKIDLVQKEVSGDRENSSELVAKAKKCGIKADSIGVPLLWNNGQCLVGDKDIIDLFSQEINTK